MAMLNNQRVLILPYGFSLAKGGSISTCIACAAGRISTLVSATSIETLPGGNMTNITIGITVVFVILYIL